MMKFKPNQTRTYDREGYKKRAACLCFKNDREDEVRHPPTGEGDGLIPGTTCSHRSPGSTGMYISPVITAGLSSKL